jgi:hypothetical protein
MGGASGTRLSPASFCRRTVLMTSHLLPAIELCQKRSLKNTIKKQSPEDKCITLYHQRNGLVEFAVHLMVSTKAK